MGQLLKTYASSTTVWNGGICTICNAKWLGYHECSVEDLERRASQLLDMARAKFDAAFTEGEPVELDVNLRREPDGCRPGCEPGGVCRWVGCKNDPATKSDD